MVSVIVKRVGAKNQMIEASTAKDVKEALGLSTEQLKVNGSVISDSHTFSEGDVVVIGEQVKGGF